MKIKFFVISIFLINTTFAQVEKISDQKWNLELNEDGIKVFTRYQTITDESGDEDELFEWKAEAEKEVNFTKIIEALENVENHKLLYECEMSEIISETDSLKIVYYYFDSPWPAPNLDMVRTISSKSAAENNSIIYNHISTPNVYEEKDVSRIEISDIEYKFTKISEKETKIDIVARFIPKGVPNFLVKGWMPDGPAKIVKNLIALSSN